MESHEDVGFFAAYFSAGEAHAAEMALEAPPPPGPLAAVTLVRPGVLSDATGKLWVHI